MITARARHRLAAAALVLAPLLLLAPCVFGPRTYVPFDIAQWPPVSTMLTADQLAEVTRAQNTDVTEVPLTFLPEWRLARQAPLRKERERHLGDVGVLCPRHLGELVGGEHGAHRWPLRDVERHVGARPEYARCQQEQRRQHQGGGGEAVAGACGDHGVTVSRLRRATANPSRPATASRPNAAIHRGSLTAAPS